jgi:hypothetical protein
MAKYTIEASEQVYYRFEVEAENADEASDKAREYWITSNDIYDGDNFKITDITEKASE